MFLEPLSWLGLLAALVAVTAAIASGLYQLSELAEEYPRATRQLLRKLLASIAVVHILLCLFDKFPLWRTGVSLGACLVYMRTLKQFPDVPVVSVTFLSAAIAAIANHWVWFSYFSHELEMAATAAQRLGSLNAYHLPPPPSFLQIVSVFGLLIWLIPILLLIGFSATDEMLPLTNPPPPGAMGGGMGGALGGEDSSNFSANVSRMKRVSIVRVAVDSVFEFFAKLAQSAGLDSSKKHSVLG